MRLTIEPIDTIEISYHQCNKDRVDQALPGLVWKEYSDFLSAVYYIEGLKLIFFIKKEVINYAIEKEKEENEKK